MKRNERVQIGALVAAGMLALTGCQEAVSPSARLVSGETGVTAIAVDDFFLYWSLPDGTIKRVSLDGGHPITLVPGRALGNGDQPDRLTLNESHVFWSTHDGRVLGAPKEGGDVLTVAEESRVQGLVADESHVYWTLQAGDLKRAPKLGGAAETLASQQQDPGPIALLGGLIWANGGASDGDGSVVQMPVEGGPPQSIAVGQDKPRALAMDRGGASVFWANLGDSRNGTISVAALDGTGARVLAENQANLLAVAGDATNAYWTSADGTLSAAPLAGGDATIVASGPAARVSLALDQTSVYWANPKDGAIMVRPKL